MDKQKILSDFTKKVAKELYDLDLYVFFHKLEGIRAIYRKADTGPWGVASEEDKKLFDKNPKASVTYNIEHFKKDELECYVWYVLVHEITHQHKGVRKNHWDFDFDDRIKDFSINKHSDEFKKQEKINLKKVEPLRKEFFKAIKQKDEYDYNNWLDDYQEEIDAMDRAIEEVENGR